MVRDDFWLAVSRFLADLEIPLVQGTNTALVDLFDPRHARKVLAAFGSAYRSLPDRAVDFSSEQNAFLDQAVADLTQDGRVISVRVALFAQMLKGRPWTPATLRAVGGTEGVGVTFLDETFSATTADPKLRLHAKAAQAVLKALLPETGTEIRGQMRSEAELRATSGYGERPRDFAELTHILDNELRLITPAEPGEVVDEGAPPTAAESARASAGDLSTLSHILDPSSFRRHSAFSERAAFGYYQLTHDYLVPALRRWLTRKRRETRRGRAELKLAERAALWSKKPENRRLPSIAEWAEIALLTSRNDWSEPERQTMKRAARVHGVRGLTLAALFTVAAWGGIEGYGTLRTLRS